VAAVDDLKRAVGREAVDRYVVDGMKLGLGTGSTAVWAVRRVAERFAAGGLPRLRVVTTSIQSDLEARSLGLPVVTLNDAGMEDGLDLTIDGADEVDARGRLIKGGGGALLVEKVVAYASRRLVIVVDRGKLSDRLGTLFAVPIEVTAAALAPVRRALEALGAEVTPRLALRKAGPVVTDLGNLLLDARFAPGFDPVALEAALDGIPGALGNGLFTRRVPEVLVAGPDGIETRTFAERSA
jgi:ribose 5-phosphate isomerase A